LVVDLGPNADGRDDDVLVVPSWHFQVVDENEDGACWWYSMMVLLWSV